MQQEMEEALRTIASMIDRVEKAQQKFVQGTSQHTLQKNRLAALSIAASLIQEELTGNKTHAYTKEELEKARAPLASLVSKSEKVRQKLAQGSWQYTMTENHLKALSIASPLLEQALRSL